MFDIHGQFERNTSETDFVTALEKELESYAKNTIWQALRRKRQHIREPNLHILDLKKFC